MLCAMWAGALAGTITNPLDMGKFTFSVVDFDFGPQIIRELIGKLRMQVQRASGEASTSFNYRHLGHAVYRIGRD